MTTEFSTGATAPDSRAMAEYMLSRQGTRYPEQPVEKIVRNANGLQTMAGMLLAMFSGNPEAGSKMSKIQPAFADCLPELLPPRNSQVVRDSKGC